MINQSLISHNIVDVLPSKEAFERRLTQGPICIYLGIDPSGTEIHIGHAIALWKLREFQDAGHKVILLIGDFTGMIGDPTDRTVTRKKLTKEEVLENARTYKKQVSKILRFEGENPVEIKFNSEWLGKLTFADALELASLITAQQMLERDYFQKRMSENKPLHLHEFFYPLMQGYDSVAMEVDAEIGGTDQTFNMLVGRTLLKALKDKEKFVLSTPLLEGLDGRKMSKSYNNYISITDTPETMYGKVMSLKDELIPRYYELAIHITGDEPVQTHPMQAKKNLAHELVRMYHGIEAAAQAQSEFEEVFQQKADVPKDSPYLITAGRRNIIDILVDSKAVESRSEAKRLVSNGAITIRDENSDQTITDPQAVIALGFHMAIQVGKKKFIKVVIH